MARHWMPVAATYWIAFYAVRKSASRGRPTFAGGGMNAPITSHSASVTSLA
jgi:hypothetical protein